MGFVVSFLKTMSSMKISTPIARWISNKASCFVGLNFMFSTVVTVSGLIVINGF